MKDLKVIFMGTPEFCVPILETLIENCKGMKEVKILIFYYHLQIMLKQ